MKKILLVEDDLSLIEGLNFSLSRHDFQVTVARTVKEAFDYLDHEEYDLLARFYPFQEAPRLCRR